MLNPITQISLLYYCITKWQFIHGIIIVTTAQPVHKDHKRVQVPLIYRLNLQRIMKKH